MSANKILDAASEARRPTVLTKPKLNKQISNLYNKDEEHRLKVGVTDSGEGVILKQIGNTLRLIGNNGNILYSSITRRRIEKHSQKLNIRWI